MSSASQESLVFVRILLQSNIYSTRPTVLVIKKLLLVVALGQSFLNDLKPMTDLVLFSVGIQIVHTYGLSVKIVFISFGDRYTYRYVA